VRRPQGSPKPPFIIVWVVEQFDQNVLVACLARNASQIFEERALFVV
jgi:hypothetical protein